MCQHRQFSRPGAAIGEFAANRALNRPVGMMVSRRLPLHRYTLALIAMGLKDGGNWNLDYASSRFSQAPAVCRYTIGGGRNGRA
jgi:hypothetical protein